MQYGLFDGMSREILRFLLVPSASTSNEFRGCTPLVNSRFFRRQPLFSKTGSINENTKPLNLLSSDSSRRVGNLASKFLCPKRTPSPSSIRSFARSRRENLPDWNYRSQNFFCFSRFLLPFQETIGEFPGFPGSR